MLFTPQETPYQGWRHHVWRDEISTSGPADLVRSIAPDFFNTIGHLLTIPMSAHGGSYAGRAKLSFLMLRFVPFSDPRAE